MEWIRKETVRRKAAISLAVVLFSSAIGQNAWADVSGWKTVCPDIPGQVKDRQTVRPPIVEPVMENTTIVNGSFEKSVDGFGNPEGWNIQFSKTNDPEGSVTYSISQEADNVNNTSRKLTLYNGMGEDVFFSITQTVYGASYGTGSYVASLIYEGAAGEGNSNFQFQVNGKSVGCGGLEGWQKWKQAMLPEVWVDQGGMMEISISGRLGSKGFLDLDDVELVLDSQFHPREFADAKTEPTHPDWEPVREAPELIVGNQIQNGDFNEELQWDVYGYPGGYLPKWKLESEDLSRWNYRITDGVLEFENISDSEESHSITISQKVHLKPGGYLFHGETGWVWDDDNEDGVCMRVEDSRGVLIAERYWNPGYGRILSDVFAVEKETDVLVSVTIQLSGGKVAALDCLELTEGPKKLKWNTAKQVGGVSGKEDTDKIRVSFSYPVFGLEEKHFTVEDAIVVSVTKEGNSSYLLELADVAFANGKEIEVKMNAPEYYELDTKKKKVKVYRDQDSFSGLQNSEFVSEVDWNRENYPDGYIPGWSLKEAVDWDVWRYNITDGVFRLNNISQSPSVEKFEMHQMVSLPKGTYTIKTNTLWKKDRSVEGDVREQESSGQIRIQVKDGKKTIAEVTGSPNQGVIQSEAFTIKKDTAVDCIFTFFLSGGKDASLQYVSILPAEEILWKGAVQLGGESQVKTTEAVELVFERDVKGLTADDFYVTGAKAVDLQSLGEGRYLLEIASLSVLDGEEITLSLDAPGGYLVKPGVYLVKVYRGEELNGTGELINGDFSVGVDWTNPSYPDGYVEGWKLPSPLDWDTWSYGTPDGVFEVTNKGIAVSDFIMEQEVILPAGIYTLEAESPYGWGDTENSGIRIWAVSGTDVLAQATGKPGIGSFGTSAFELKKTAKVIVKLQMIVAPSAGGSGMGVDHIGFEKQEAMVTAVSWDSAVQFGGEDKAADSTGVVMKFSQDIPGFTSDWIQVTGAEKGILTAKGNGTYELAVSDLTVENGKTITVSVSSPKGYRITPAIQRVTIYRAVSPELPDKPEEPDLPNNPDDNPFADPIVNGDFSVGVDWSNPSYPDGYVEGWKLPSPLDWGTWSYGTPDGVFEVTNKGAAASDFVMEQEVTLPAGIYTLEAESPYGWGDTDGCGVEISVRGAGGMGVQAFLAPGAGRSGTEAFELEKEEKVTIKVQLTAPAGGGMSVGKIGFKKLETSDPDEPDPPIDPDPEEPDPPIDPDPEEPDPPIDPDPDEPDPPTDPDPEEFADPIVNGDFSVGVDWDAGGSVEGWIIDSVDWNVWKSYSGSGGEWGDFWVTRTDQESDTPLSLHQEVELKAGTYKLGAKSEGTWDGALTDAVTLRVEGNGAEITSKSVQPGYGEFWTDEFTIDSDMTADIIISFKLPGGKEMGIDNIKLEKVDLTSNAEKETMKKPAAEEEKEDEEIKKATSSNAASREDEDKIPIENLWILDEDEWMINEDEWMRNEEESDSAPKPEEEEKIVLQATPSNGQERKKEKEKEEETEKKKEKASEKPAEEDPEKICLLPVEADVTRKKQMSGEDLEEGEMAE